MSAPLRRPARVACLLAGCPHTDDAVQAVAELGANAIQHTLSAAPGGLLVVEVRRWRGGAAVSVTDQGGPTIEDALSAAGLVTDAYIERRPYEQEVETTRAYLLAHRPG